MRDGWVETTLGDVAIWGSGGTPKSGVAAFYDGEIPWCVIGDLNEGEVLTTERRITQEGLKNSSAKIVQPGAVMIAMYGASIGRTGIVGKPMATNQAIAYAYPKIEVLDNWYLLAFLQTQKMYFVEAGQGAAQPNISQTVIKAWPIILPPLAEQKRIVDVVSSVDAYICALSTSPSEFRESKDALNAARRLRSALLLDLLSGNHGIPDSYDQLLRGKV
jgi:type I restriction enzyme S subunit